MPDELKPRGANTIDRLLATRGFGVVPELSRTYHDCVEMQLSEQLQRLLDRLDEGEGAKVKPPRKR